MSSQRYPSRLESRAGFFASTRDEGLSPRVRLECNPEIPVAPGEEHWLLDTSLDEVYWPCRRRRPSSLDDGGISGLFSSGGPSVRSLTRYDGEVSEPLVGRQGSRVSMRVARGSASLLPSHGRGIWPRDVLKKVSRGLSRVEAGNPGFPRLVQVTSGGFSWWL